MSVSVLSRYYTAQAQGYTRKSLSEAARIRLVPGANAWRRSSGNGLRTERAELLIVDTAHDHEAHREKGRNGTESRHFLSVGRAARGTKDAGGTALAERL